MGAWSDSHRRGDRDGLVEYHCEHGVGHPAYGSALWIAEAYYERKKGYRSDYALEDELEAQLTHGCCGCCSSDGFPGSPEESLVHAHKLIRRLVDENNDLQKKIRSLKTEIGALYAGPEW